MQVFSFTSFRFSGHKHVLPPGRKTQKWLHWE